jgi:hypothetical protein
MSRAALAAFGFLALPATAGWWQLETIENKMDQRTKIFLSVSGSDVIPGQVGRERGSVLAIRCEAGKVELAFVAYSQLSGPEDDLYDHKFRVRFDSAKPEALRGTKSTARDAVFFPNPRAYIARIRKAERVMVEVTPFQRGPATASFPVLGLDEHKEALAKHCGIK